MCKLEDIRVKPDHWFKIDDKGNPIIDNSVGHWGGEDIYFCENCNADFYMASHALEHVGIKE